MTPNETVTTKELVLETLTQMSRNSRQLLPIMGLIWLVQLPSFLSDERFLPTDAMQMLGLPPGAASTIPAILVKLATYLGPSWSAVGWHRLVLLDEQPGSILPRWHTQPLLSYIIISIFLPVLTWGVPIVALLLVAGILQLLGAPPLLIIIPGLPAAVVAIWLTLRLSPVQVSRAVQDPMGLAEANRRTAQMSRPLWGVALLGLLAMAVLVGATVFIDFYLLTNEAGRYRNDIAMYLYPILYGGAFFLLFLTAISMFNTIYRRIHPHRIASVFA